MIFIGWMDGFIGQLPFPGGKSRKKSICLWGSIY
jgi:hypothetical protein